MPKVLHFSDPSNGRPGRGATIQFENGEPCLVSIARSGVLVKKSRFGFLGLVLFDEKNVYKVAATAKVLSERYSNTLLPAGFTDSLLCAFVNAMMHCSSCAEVAFILNEALATALQPREAAALNEQALTNGNTPASAIRIDATDSLDGIPKEYAILDALFGTPGHDWAVIARSIVETDVGRTLDRFVVSAFGKRREIYFDVTSWIRNNTKDTKADLERMFALHDRTLSILLPKEEFITLLLGVMRLADEQLDLLGLSSADRKSMLDPFLDITKRWGKEFECQQMISVSAPFSVWSKIVVLLKAWEPSNPVQQREIENSKLLIASAMKMI